MKLTCFRTGSKIEPGKLPDRIRVLNWGENPNVKGVTAKLGDKTLATFSANQRARGFDRVALDYEHNTVPGSEAFKSSSEPRKVAGYGVPLLIPGDGLFLDLMTYTPSGMENAAEFIDVSGAVKLDDETGEVVFMHSAALCRQGAVEGLSLFSVDIADPEMPPPAPTNWKAFIASMTGLGEDASDEDLKAAFQKHIADAIAEATRAMSEKIGALEQTTATLSTTPPVPGELTTLSATVQSLTGRLDTFAVELDRRDRADLCRQAASEGKVIPLSADQIAGTPIATLRDMVTKLPVTVPLAQRTPERIETLSAGAVPETVIARVARQCGVDPKLVVQSLR